MESVYSTLPPRTVALLKRIDAAAAERQWYYLELCVSDVWPKHEDLATLPPSLQAARWICALGALEHLQIGIDIGASIRSPLLIDAVCDLKDLIRDRLRALPTPAACLAATG